MKKRELRKEIRRLEIALRLPRVATVPDRELLKKGDSTRWRMTASGSATIYKNDSAYATLCAGDTFTIEQEHPSRAGDYSV